MKIIFGKKIHNPIIIVIVSTVIVICSLILFISAIPYAIARGVCNLDYYREWFDFIDSKIKIIVKKSNE